MDHNFEAQRRETFDTFRQSKGISLPKTAVVEYAFFIEELDASWPALERAVGSSRVDLQACKLEYSIVSPK